VPSGIATPSNTMSAGLLFLVPANSATFQVVRRDIRHNASFRMLSFSPFLTLEKKSL
jgi:hypothetical protein